MGETYKGNKSLNQQTLKETYQYRLSSLRILNRNSLTCYLKNLRKLSNIMKISVVKIGDWNSKKKF